jgi:EAL domain-containing protein (putative c-di-GMP-specific phosphodiesterase class I)
LSETSASEVLAGLVSFVERTDAVVGMCDAWGRLIYLNPAACKLLGVGSAEGLTLADVFPNESFAVFYEVARPELLRRGSWSGKVVANSAGPSAVLLDVSATMDLGPGGENRGLVLIGRVLGPVDAPTPDAAADDARAVVVFDLTDAAAAASDLGPEIIEQIMQAAAARLMRLTHSSESLDAPSEHQLAVVLRGIGSRHDAMRVALNIERELEEPPVETTVGQVPVTISHRVAFSAGDRDPAELLRIAATRPSDIEVDRQRSQPPATRPAGAEAVELAELQLAFSHGAIKAYAQAIVEPRTTSRVGYRGFAQWHHHTRGVLGPSTVADIAADTSLAPVIDLHVARETATLLVLAPRASTLVQQTAVSARLLLDVRAEQYFDEIAAAFFLAMHQFRIAVDARRVSAASLPMRDALRSLADAGLSLVLGDVRDREVDLDDLARLGFRALDLSPDLVADATVNPVVREAVVELVERAHRANLLVGASGVDTEPQHETILRLRCDAATGDFYAPAQLAEVIGDE